MADDERILAAAVLVPPSVLAAVDPGCSPALDAAGTFGITLLFGIVPAACAWQLRREDESSEVFVPGGDAVLAAMVGLSAFVTRRVRWCANMSSRGVLRSCNYLVVVVLSARRGASSIAHGFLRSAGSFAVPVFTRLLILVGGRGYRITGQKQRLRRPKPCSRSFYSPSPITGCAQPRDALSDSARASTPSTRRQNESASETDALLPVTRHDRARRNGIAVVHRRHARRGE